VAALATRTPPRPQPDADATALDEAQFVIVACKVRKALQPRWDAQWDPRTAISVASRDWLDHEHQLKLQQPRGRPAAAMRRAAFFAWLARTVVDARAASADDMDGLKQGMQKLFGALTTCDPPYRFAWKEDHEFEAGCGLPAPEACRRLSSRVASLASKSQAQAAASPEAHQGQRGDPIAAPHSYMDPSLSYSPLVRPGAVAPSSPRTRLLHAIEDARRKSIAANHDIGASVWVPSVMHLNSPGRPM